MTAPRRVPLACHHTALTDMTAAQLATYPVWCPGCQDSRPVATRRTRRVNRGVRVPAGRWSR